MLVAVVGPSGAGKDTLMASARARIGPDGRFRFVRRSITRPASAGVARTTSRSAATPSSAAATRAASPCGGKRTASSTASRAISTRTSPPAAAWSPTSRAACWRKRRRDFPLLVLEITAPPAVLAARLAARGREEPEAVAARLAREAPLPSALRVRRVVNDGSMEVGAAQMAQALLDAAEGRAA